MTTTQRIRPTITATDNGASFISDEVGVNTYIFSHADGSTWGSSSFHVHGDAVHATDVDVHELPDIPDKVVIGLGQRHAIFLPRTVLDAIVAQTIARLEPF